MTDNSATTPQSQPDWPYVALTLGAATLGIALPTAARRLARRLGSILPQRQAERLSDTILLGASLATMYAVIEWGERTYPHRADWNTPDRSTAEEAAYLLAISPLEGFAVEAVCTKIADAAWRSLGRQRPQWNGTVPLPIRVAAAITVTEAGHYAHHRLAHEWSPLWRYHAKHHELVRLSWRNATIFHPLDMLPLMVSQELPVRILGIDADTTLAMRTLKGVHGQLQHANVGWTSRKLGVLFSTNEQHRWHHARSTGGRVNYGAILSIFDRIFGSLHDTTETLPAQQPIGC